MKKVWTFHIKSGPSIKMRPSDNPSLDYPGYGRVLWKVVVTKEVADSYLEQLTNLGCSVALFTEDMTDEMRREKEKLQKTDTYGFTP